MLHVIVTSPERVLFDGSARSVIFPGEQGTFEVQMLHRPLVTRLVRGVIVIDEKQAMAIRRGLVRVGEDEVTAAVEQ